ncbi:epoxide hydrolase 1-like [Acanthaster planci]|uniref:Epoxide hydrolase n=1 Tax=Acanthaster planci TaxID=133434 RepID=A0A8B7Y880_ACAPL|nr:epoxide hydrolase 1-like [Acanthaster planci]XP_022088768.1 epoxide hydrolase 1-like [Acanthaster planci]XP_022088770.1 epoxide hydrolase 1-like [Acanthaster planci]
MGWKLAAIVLLLGLGIAYMSGLFSSPPDPPEIGDGWWGRGDKPKKEENTSVNRFNIHFPDADLANLKERLRVTRWFESVEGTKFHFGIKPEYMKKIADYWLNKYDWRKKEQELNQYQSYKTKIEGIDIHFVRAVPRLKVGQKAKPILMVHGWPGSFYEFYKIIPMLIDPTRHGGTEDDIFEVIVPSLPGYGFSEAAHKQGLNARAAGRIFHKLMTRLGFDSYYVQGGDWGAMVTDQMAGMFPSHVRGIHVNMIVTQPPVSQMILGSLFPSLVLESEGYARSLPSWEYLKFWLKETGYAHIQGTKPDTVGHALTDSPVGLAAYIIEKFSSWTNYAWLDFDDGGLDAHWSKDDLLTNVMIYWVSGCITSSMRLYKETIQFSGSLSKFLNTVPAGLADLPNELTRAQKNWASQHYTDIVSYMTYPTGGHFAAFEVPDLLAKDLRQFVQKVEHRLLNKPK